MSKTMDVVMDDNTFVRSTAPCALLNAAIKQLDCLVSAIHFAAIAYRPILSPFG
jgi:hypothetical protein